MEGYHCDGPPVASTLYYFIIRKSIFQALSSLLVFRRLSRAAILFFRRCFREYFSKISKSLAIGAIWNIRSSSASSAREICQQLSPKENLIGAATITPSSPYGSLQSSVQFSLSEALSSSCFGLVAEMPKHHSQVSLQRHDGYFKPLLTLSTPL